MGFSICRAARQAGLFVVEDCFDLCADRWFVASLLGQELVHMILECIYTFHQVFTHICWQALL